MKKEVFDIGDRVIYRRSPHSSQVGYICSITLIDKISDESYELYRKSGELPDLFYSYTQSFLYGVLFFTFEVDDAGRQSIYTINDISPAQLELCNDIVENKEETNMTTQNFTLGLKDINGKFIHVNDVLKFENEEVVPILDDGSGPIEHTTELLVVTAIGDEIKFNTISSFVDVCDQNDKIVSMSDIKFCKKSFSDTFNGYQGLISSYSFEDEFEIIGKYNPLINEITLLN